MAAPTEATALTAAPVNGVVLLLGVTAPVPDADGAEAAGAAAAVVVGWGENHVSFRLMSPKASQYA